MEGHVLFPSPDASEVLGHRAGQDLHRGAAPTLGPARAAGPTRPAGPAQGTRPAQEVGEAGRRVGLAPQGHGALGREVLAREQRADQRIPEGSGGAGLGDRERVGRDEARVVDGGDGDAVNAGRAQLLADGGPLGPARRVGEQPQEALEVARRDVFLDVHQGRVPAVEGLGERSHIDRLDLLLPVEETVARHPQHQAARGSHERGEPGMRGVEGRCARGVPGRIGEQILPRRDEERHGLEECLFGARSFHAYGHCMWPLLVSIRRAYEERSIAREPAPLGARGLPLWRSASTSGIVARSGRQGGHTDGDRAEGRDRDRRGERPRPGHGARPRRERHGCRGRRSECDGPGGAGAPHDRHAGLRPGSTRRPRPARRVRGDRGRRPGAVRADRRAGQQCRHRPGVGARGSATQPDPVLGGDPRSVEPLSRRERHRTDHAGPRGGATHAASPARADHHRDHQPRHHGPRGLFTVRPASPPTCSSPVA